MRRTTWFRVLAICLAALAVAACDVPGIGGAKGRELKLREVGRFDQPLFLAPVPGEDSLAVVEKTGRVIVVDGDERSTLVDLSGEVSTGSEQGLLGLAFHPQFERNGRLFLNYTDRSGDTRIVEYRASDGSAERVRELMHIDQPYPNHNGGHLVFGPDGMLWIGMGDGGSGDDPENRAQDPRQLLGKLLRIDVDKASADKPYSIPEGNAGGDARGEVWAVGLRNPWRFTFDHATGLLYIGDVGQGQWEEIDVVDPAAAPKGGFNFGWDAFEGSAEHVGELRGDRHTPPVYEYSHDHGCSVTGGHVYRGSAARKLRGWYVLADFCSSWIRAFRTAESVDELGQISNDEVREYEGVAAIASFAEDADGELYVISLEGQVLRVS